MVDQKTEFEIGLKDTISPQLQAIAKQLKEINRMAKESGESGSGSVDKIRKSNEGFGRSAREALEHFKKVGETVLDFGKDLLGAGGTLETLRRVGEGIDEFATSTTQMKYFAENTGLAVDEIKSMRDAMSAMGIGTEQANKYIGDLTTKLQGLQSLREGSPLYQQLSAMPGGGPQFAKKLLGDVQVEDYNKAIEDILNFYKEAGPRAQIYLSQVFGLRQTVLEHLDELQTEINKRLGDRYKEDEQLSQQYMINKTIFLARWESETNRFFDHALTDVNKFWDSVNKNTGGHTFSDWMNSEWDAVTKTIQQDIKDFEALKSLYDKAKEFFKKAGETETPSVMKWLGLGEAPPGTKDAEQEKKENADKANKALVDIDRILKFGSADASGGDGFGGAYGGALQATGGGFRPGRAGRASGDGSSSEQDAAEKPVAGQLELGKATPGGAAPAGSGYNYFQHHGHNYPFARSELEDIKTPYGNATVHPQAAADLKGFLDEIHEAGAPIKNLGSYNPRPKRWGGGPSSHGMGAAWDIDDATALSPAMKQWIANNPEKWAAAKERWNIGQPLPEKDAPHLEWRGPHGSTVEEARKRMDSSVFDKGTSAITFNFKNVPPNVKTNADTDGYDQVQINHQKAIPQSP
jgi:hypothetical protein